MTAAQPAKMMCLACGSPVRHVNPAAWRRGRGRYCSRACRPGPTTHRHTVGGQSPTFKVWHGMKQRCLNANHQSFARYGGRGIRVCDEWLNFGGFLASMGVRPEGLTLDRIDPDGDYEPDNCRWATMKEQCNNWSGNRNTHVIYNGESFTLQELSDRLRLNRYTLRRRIFDMQWPQEMWAQRPSKRKRVHFG